MKRTLLASLLLLIILATISSAVTTWNLATGVTNPDNSNVAVIKVYAYVGGILAPAKIEVSEGYPNETLLGTKTTPDGMMNIYIPKGKTYAINAATLDEKKSHTIVHFKVNENRQTYLYMTPAPF